MGWNGQLFEKILVPVDGSTSAERLIAWTGGLAKRLNAKIVLLAAADPVEWIPWPPAAAWREDEGSDPLAADINPYPDPEQLRGSMREYQARTMERALDNARSYLSGQAEKLRSSGVDVSAEVRHGSPTDVIPDVISDEGISLVVMSSRRTSALARGILGSVADRVLRSSPVPVIVLHPEYIRSASVESAIETVIVPLDGSDFSELAIGPAFELGAALQSKMLFLVAVQSTAAGGDPDTERQDSMAEYLGQFVEVAQAEHLQARSRIVDGPAARAIIEESDANPHSLIVMGTHGRGGFRRFLIGSVADKIVRTASTPVMVVPPRARAE